MTTSYNKDFILFIILNQPSFTLLSEEEVRLSLIYGHNCIRVYTPLCIYK